MADAYQAGVDAIPNEMLAADDPRRFKPYPLRPDDVRNIPFYAADPGRVGTMVNVGGQQQQVFTNRSGQPNVQGTNGERMYPSAARTQMVPNPMYYKGGPLPRFIPADLAAELQSMSQGK